MDVLKTKAEKAAYMRAWYKSEAGRACLARRREAHALYNREWNTQNIERRREQNRASRQKNCAKAREYRRNYHCEFGFKDQARKAVFDAIAAGSLVRPDRCSDCGKECKPDGHHHLGYEQENWLSVQWLCRTCHRKADAKLWTV